MRFRHTSPEEEALDDSRHESRRHTERMRANWDHYIAELATKTTHQCRVHRCFDVITEGGYCVKHNERRWD